MQACILAAMHEDDLRLITIRDLAELLQVKESWIYDKVQAGEIPSIKVGGHRRFRRSAIRAYLDSLEEEKT